MMRSLLGLSLLTAIVFTTHDTVKAAGTFIPSPSRIDMVYDSAAEVVYITNGDSLLRYHFGSASITSNGTLINYRPRNGYTGIDSFTYTISDGQGGTSTATVTVDVRRR